MLDLTNKIWQELEGGYHARYDASVPLKQLELADKPTAIQKILGELWTELHHQGQVGLASYLAVPQLVRIAKSKPYFDWNILGLCNVIEIQRHMVINPVLPVEFKGYYEKGLKELKQFVQENINKDLDDATYIIALSTLATCSGRIKLGKAIMEMEDKDLLDKFLEQF